MNAAVIHAVASTSLSQYLMCAIERKIRVCVKSLTYNRFSLKRGDNTMVAIAVATAYGRVYVIC